MRGNLVELAVCSRDRGRSSAAWSSSSSRRSSTRCCRWWAGRRGLSFGNLVFRVGKATFTYGQFVTVALSFLISALVVYYAMVLPVGQLLRLLERNKATTTRDCAECTMCIPMAPRRCPECTARSLRPPSGRNRSARARAWRPTYRRAWCITWLRGSSAKVTVPCSHRARRSR